MRRLFVVLFALVALAPHGTAVAQVRPDDPRQGLVYDGLRRSAGDSLCKGAFEAFLDARVPPGMKQVLCTHGPDPAPEGVDVRAEQGPASRAVAGAEAAVPCYGTGSDGYRVQLLYARSSSAPDRYLTYAASFQNWAARMDQVVNDSAAETGGARHIRFVTDFRCNPTVQRVTLTAGAMSSFGNMVSELHAKGYSRSDRKYLVWADTNVYCGIAEIYADDSVDPTPGRNYNNGHPYIQGAVGRVDNGCWGLPNLVEAHELLHLLGGVQPTAPNATPGFHCTDESDRLCYNDGSGGGGVRQVCPGHETLYDCNHDDYFNTAPPPGSYLSSHWNTASSAFLSGGAAVTPTPTTTTAPPPTTTTTNPPTSTTSTTRATTTTTTATTAPPSTVAPTTSTTAPPATGVPSAPQYLAATQPAVGSGVQLAWQPPAAGPVSGYRIYRGTSPYLQTLLAEVGNVNGYTDASAARTLYYYRVSAFNAAGEGPSSALTGMIGKSATPAGVVQEDIDRRLVVTGSRLGAPAGPAISTRR